MTISTRSIVVMLKAAVLVAAGIWATTVWEGSCDDSKSVGQVGQHATR